MLSIEFQAKEQKIWCRVETSDDRGFSRHRKCYDFLKRVINKVVNSCSGFSNQNKQTFVFNQAATEDSFPHGQHDLDIRFFVEVNACEIVLEHAFDPKTMADFEVWARLIQSLNRCRMRLTRR
jgi:hypothetical protein